MRGSTRADSLTAASPKFVSTIFALPLVVTSIYGCKLNSSNLRHEFGATRIGVDESMFEPCDRSEFDPKYSEANDYLTALGAEIMRKNPETFTGVYAPEKICIYVTNDSVAGASTSPRKRTIQFTIGILRWFSNDAEVAAVLAHELAHIARMHNKGALGGFIGGWEYKFNVRPEAYQYIRSIADRPDVVKLRERLDQAVTEQKKLQQMDEEFSAKIQDSLNSLFQFAKDQGFTDQDLKNGNPKVHELLVAQKSAEIAKHSEMLQRYEEEGFLDKRIRKDREVIEIKLAIEDIIKAALPAQEHFSWTEREADDVGLELFVRTGLDPNYYSSFPRIFLKREEANWAPIGGTPPPSRTVSGCKQLIEQVMKTGVQDIKIYEDFEYAQARNIPHPDLCYRWYQIVRELELHKSDYAPFIGQTREIFPGRLQRVKSL